MGRRKLSDTEKRNELIVVRTTRREKLIIKAIPTTCFLKKKCPKPG